ncbi:HoxN/HupN/NixA family nickel/cobalt transporter [Mycoplana ramosa]|uniref:Nickel/cobalt efflux system n=1 Tax=Mycoplana ramosa TaxID=40837 RepID=A0ABW3YS89_MYCRA
MTTISRLSTETGTTISTKNSGGWEQTGSSTRTNSPTPTTSANRNVTTWQIALFGLTGGLIPCPAAITALLLCLQLKEITLGFVLVLCFSIGLAITLVTVGALAALSVRHATRRWSWFNVLARRAPYVSSLMIIAVGLAAQVGNPPSPTIETGQQ